MTNEAVFRKFFHVVVGGTKVLSAPKRLVQLLVGTEAMGAEELENIQLELFLSLSHFRRGGLIQPKETAKITRHMLANTISQRIISAHAGGQIFAKRPASREKPAK